ncbi:unnamed protein product, partial [Acanthoscelides obtectus]
TAFITQSRVVNCRCLIQLSRDKKGDNHWAKCRENVAGAVTFPSRVQNFFLGSQYKLAVMV